MPLFSTTSYDATIATFALSLTWTILEGGPDRSNVRLFKPYPSPSPSSSLPPKEGLGGALPLLLFWVLCIQTTEQLVIKSIKLQQNSSNNLTWVSTSRIHYNPSFEQYSQDKVDGVDCVRTEPAYTRQMANAMTVRAPLSKPKTRLATDDPSTLITSTDQHQNGDLRQEEDALIIRGQIFGRVQQRSTNMPNVWINCTSRKLSLRV